MLSTKEFAKNKLFRGVAYAIVIGFALLMFLPGSYNLFDVIRGGGGQNFITVNGNEIFYTAGQNNNLANIFQDWLSRGTQAKGVKAFTLNNALNSWKNPVDYLSIYLRNAIVQQMQNELAEDLDIDISKEKLRHYMFLVYKREKERHFNDPQNKNTPFPELNSFRRNYGKNLPKQYKVQAITNTLQNGILFSVPKLVEDYNTQNHEVKVDFAVYTFDNYIKDPNVFSKLKKADLEKYYHEKIEKMTILEAVFKTKEEAVQAKSDKDFFIQKKDKFTEKTIRTNDKLFKELKSYKDGDIISKDKEHYLYKIKSMDKPFDKLKEGSSEYKSVLTKYASDHYNDFKLDYEKKAKTILNAFLTKAKSGAVFSSISKDKYLKTGRTDYFKLDANSVSSEKKANSKGLPDNIDEFIYSKLKYYDEDKEINEAFFTTSFYLKKGDISSIKSYVMKNKDVYFVIKKVSERLGDSKSILSDTKKQSELVNNTKNDYQRIINKLWGDYLISKYPVKIYTSNIYALFNIEEPKLPAKQEDK